MRIVPGSRRQASEVRTIGRTEKISYPPSIAIPRRTLRIAIICIQELIICATKIGSSLTRQARLATGIRAVSFVQPCMAIAEPPAPSAKTISYAPRPAPGRMDARGIAIDYAAGPTARTGLLLSDADLAS